MDKRMGVLRAIYWIGAIFDALVIVPMMFPEAASALLGLPGFSPGKDYRYAMALGGSLMAGWTVLLLWADRKPIERRGVLLITLFPVLSGLIAADLYAAASGFVPLSSMVPIWISQAALFALAVTALVLTAPLARANRARERAQEAKRESDQAR
jgi:hypothetical protein